MGSETQLLSKPWYYLDFNRGMNCCFIKQLDPSEGEALEFQQTGHEWSAIGQVDCFRGSSSFGKAGTSPVGVIVKDGNEFRFFPHAPSTDSLQPYSTPINTDSKFFVVDSSDYGNYRLKNVTDKKVFEKTVLGYLNYHTNRRYRGVRKTVPDLQVATGGEYQGAFAGDNETHMFGPFVDATIFPFNNIAGLRLSFMRGFAFDRSLSDTGIILDHLRLLAVVKLYEDPDGDFGFELTAGHDHTFTTGSWGSSPSLRTASFEEVGPLNSYGLDFFTGLTDFMKMRISVGAGPIRYDRRTSCGVVEHDGWTVSASVALTFDPIAIAKEAETVHRSLRYPTCNDEPGAPVKMIGRPPNPHMKKIEERKENEQPPPESNGDNNRDNDVGEIFKKHFGDDVTTESGRECGLVETVKVEVGFAKGKHALSERSKGSVDTVAKLIRDAIRDMRKIGQTIESIEVHGYASIEGSARNNFDLSQKRAAVVAARLKAGGIQIPITVVGHGEDPKHLKGSASASRRTEIKFKIDTSWDKTDQ